MTNLTFQEATVIFVLKGLKLKEGRQLLQGKFPQELNPYNYFEELPPPLPTSRFLKLWSIEFPEWSERDPAQILSSIRFKGLRQNAQLALLAYWLHRWPLIGRWDYPSPEELLVLQANGQRVVSVLLEKNYEDMITEDKNNLEFTIHDLEHAAKYFEDPLKAERQKAQFKNLVLLSEQASLQKMISSDQHFQKDWHYLISDMNTAPEHSWFFFRGTLLNAFKRKAQIPFTEKLPIQLETEFSNLEALFFKEYFQV